MSLEKLPKFLLNFSESEMQGEKRHSYRFKAFRLEVEERQLLHHDRPVPLTPKAFDVLVALVERSGHLVEKDELMRIVWSDSFVEEANVARLVHTLRKTLGDDGNGNKFIETVAKKGYRFVTKVNKISEPIPVISKNGNENYSNGAEKLSKSSFLRLTTDEDKSKAPNPKQAEPIKKDGERNFLARLILIAVIGGGITLAMAAWFYLPKFLGSRAPVYQSIQASRLTDTGTAYWGEISPEGRFVAFIDRKDGKESLAVRQVATGSVITLVPPATINFYQPTFTSDGEFVYYVTIDKGVGTLYRIPTLGGESKKIIVDVDSKVAFSPDGKRFAFVRHDASAGGESVFIADRDGTNAESFLQSKEIDYDNLFGIDWSPDGDKILLGLNKNERKPNQTFKVAAVTVRDKKLEIIGDKEWFRLIGFRWTKDGAGIIVIGKLDWGANTQIWHLDYPGGRARLITTDTNNYNSVSIESDNNSMVATQVESISSIWSLNPQSKETNQLMGETTNLLFYLGMSQMPDGKILYVKKTNNEVNIFSMNENGTGETQLTSNSETNHTPTLSPDGRYIVFVSNRSGYSAVWRMNTDGAGAVQLSMNEKGTDLQPEVTADGKTVIFTRANTGGGSLKMMKVSIDGGEAVPMFPEDSSAQNLPRISPDGKRIAYNPFTYDSSTGSVDSAVKIVEFDGEKIVPPQTELKFDIPAQYKWTPGGKSLTYISKKTGVDNLWTISIEDGKETPLTNFSFGSITDFHWSTDGQKLFIVKTVLNSNLVMIKDVSQSF